jgi:hypothetical protein
LTNSPLFQSPQKINGSVKVCSSLPTVSSNVTMSANNKS